MRSAPAKPSSGPSCGLGCPFSSTSVFTSGSVRKEAWNSWPVYLIEKALSVDNIFVFLVVLSYFSVPASYQHRVLFWGILGALVMRGLFILAGAVHLETFHWIIFLFGGFLIFTGVKMLKAGSVEVHPERNPALRLFQRLVPTVPQYAGTRFVVRRGGRFYATPLLLVLVVVEATDLLFAVDSVPAVFAVTRDPFICLHLKHLRHPRPPGPCTSCSRVPCIDFTT